MGVAVQTVDKNNIHIGRSSCIYLRQAEAIDICNEGLGGTLSRLAYKRASNATEDITYHCERLRCKNGTLNWYFGLFSIYVDWCRLMHEDEADQSHSISESGTLKSLPMTTPIFIAFSAVHVSGLYLCRHSGKVTGYA